MLFLALLMLKPKDLLSPDEGRDGRAGWLGSELVQGKVWDWRPEL